MKRLLILFAIIYYIICAYPCNYETSPKSVSVCLSKEVADPNNICCFFKAPPGNQNVTSCYEIPKNESERKAYISKNYPNARSFTYICNGSSNYNRFLGISLLLFTALILL